MFHEISPIPMEITMLFSHGFHGFHGSNPPSKRAIPRSQAATVSGPRAAEHGLRDLRRKAQGAQAPSAVRGEAAGQTDADRNASRRSGDEMLKN